MIITILITTIIILVLMTGIRIIRPTERGLIEFLGRYQKTANPGFNWLIPIIQQLVVIDITEKLVDSKSQEIITKDKLNAQVDAQIYYKIKEDEQSIKKSQYQVDDIDYQMVSLARTTLRNIIGNMTLTESNSERGKINKQLREQLSNETKNWGVEIVRAELKEIQPPRAVQEAMNKVVMAENEKIASKDFAEAEEIKADGVKRAKIKIAQASAESVRIEAEAKAKGIEMVNTAVEKTFTKKAQYLRSLEAVEKSLGSNAKIVLPANEKLVNVIGNLVGDGGA